MGGTSGEADGSEEVDILAVFLNSYRVWVGVQKWLYWELLVRLTPHLDTVYLRVCPTTRCIVFVAMMSWVHMGVHNVSGVLFWPEKAPKQGKVPPGVCRCTPRV